MDVFLCFTLITIHNNKRKLKITWEKKNLPQVYTSINIAKFLFVFPKALQLEKKQLTQQWYSSLIGMRRRDEAFAAMQEALRWVIWGGTTKLI